MTIIVFNYCKYVNIFFYLHIVFNYYNFFMKWLLLYLIIVNMSIYFLFTYCF